MLRRQVIDAGLMRRRHGFYAAMLGGVLAALAGLAVCSLVLGNSWWQLAVAAAVGGVLAQLGFLGHEASHRQVFDSNRLNEWTGRLLANLGVGMSHGWWVAKHRTHHRAPNQQGTDPDINPGVISFTPAAAAARTGPAARLVRYQGWLIFPLLAFEGLQMHQAGIARLTRRVPVPHRRTELALLTVRLAGYVTVLFVFLPPGKAAAFLGVQLAVFGFLLGGAFVPNHTGMPLVAPEAELDFLRRQVLTSRNISGRWPTRLALGGLDHQIEHHLFPQMPRPNLRAAAPIVRAFCAEHGIPYTETTLPAAFGYVIRYLNTVGMRNRHPFTCHLIRELRA